MAYDAFISYRRTDASDIAHWIRNRLQRYRLPKKVLPLLPAKAKELHANKLRVFIDRAYEKANDDFLEKKIFPALDDSRRLIVISTPSVFDSIRDADGFEHPNWLVREIDYFVETAQNSANMRPIDLVLGPGGADQKYPGRLADKARWDWIDLRNFSWRNSWGISASLDEGFIKLVAAVYDVPDEALPLLREEERRQRRKLIVISSAIAFIVTVLISILTVGWWTEVNARRAVDGERQLNIALELIDNGAIDRAIDILAHLEEVGSSANRMEAKRLMQAWVPRLVTAKHQLGLIQNNTIFRWRGLNYLKTDGRVIHSFEGPSVLQSAISSNGEWLFTFEADRAIRVRSLHLPGKPIIETERFNVSPGIVSDLLQGKILVFEGDEYALGNYEDSGDQMVQGQRIVLLDPIAEIYGTALISYDNDRFLPSCVKDQAVVGRGFNVVSPAEQKYEESKGILTLSVDDQGQIHWDTDEKNPLERNDTSGVDYTLNCLTRLNEKTTGKSTEIDFIDFIFPKLIDETLMWTKLGIIPRTEPLPDVCTGGGNDEYKSENCYDGTQAISVDDARSDTLSAILEYYFITPKVFNVDSQQRIVITAALGDDYWGHAICDFKDHQVIRKCLVANSSLNSALAYSQNNRFLILSGREIHEKMFQLFDLRSMDFISFSPPVMEHVDNVSVSPNGAQIAIDTGDGEVWIYEFDKKSAIAKISARHDFGKLFDSMSLVSNERLVLSGSRGGIVTASIPSGEIIWSRPSVKLSENGSHAISAAENTLAIYDREGMQLLSLDTGAQLSQVLKFSSLPGDADAVEDEDWKNWFSLRKGANKEIQFVYKGVIYGPDATTNINSLDWSVIEQRTGRSRAGTKELLPYFLGE